MASTIKQRLRRYNGTDYDSIYLSANVGDAVGTLPVSNGGTGRATLTSGYFLRGNGTSAITMSTAAASRNAMGLGNTTGALPVANGGTGLSSLTSGCFLLGNGTGAVTMSTVDTVKSLLDISDSVKVGYFASTAPTGSSYNWSTRITFTYMPILAFAFTTIANSTGRFGWVIGFDSSGTLSILGQINIGRSMSNYLNFQWNSGTKRLTITSTNIDNSSATSGLYFF